MSSLGRPVIVAAKRIGELYISSYSYCYGRLMLLGMLLILLCAENQRSNQSCKVISLVSIETQLIHCRV